MQSRKTEALTLEHRLSDFVNQAYGLTPEEIRPLAKVVAGVVWGLKNAIATLRVSDRPA